MSTGAFISSLVQTLNVTRGRCQETSNHTKSESRVKSFQKRRNRKVLCVEAPVFSTPNSASAAAAIHPSLKYGYPISAHIVVKDGFVVQFDPRTRNPLYVLEYITPSSIKNITVKRGCSREDSEEADETGLTTVSGYFVEEETVPKRMRNRMNDFVKSGYDRGHLAPAGNHRDTVKGFRDTFTLANISPQVAEFNRGYWGRLEMWARNVAKDHDSTIIATGPLYIPGIVPDSSAWWMQHHCIGTNMSNPVYVPTHYFKILLCETMKDGKKDIYLACFILPNMDIDDKIPLEQFLVPLHEVEELAGVEFFPELLDEKTRDMLRKYETDKMFLPKALRRALQSHAASSSERIGSNDNTAVEEDSKTLLYEHVAGGTSLEQHYKNVTQIKNEKEQKAIQRTGMPIYHLCQFRRCTMPPRRIFPEKKPKAEA